MTSRRFYVVVVAALLLSGCASEAEDGSDPKTDTIEAFDLRSSEPGSVMCGAKRPQKARLYRARDGSFAWLDSGADGTVDGISADGAIYLRDPAETAGPTPSRWVEVPAGVADPVSYFAYFLHPWSQSGPIFDTSMEPFHEFQALHDKGKKSPAPMFEDDPQGLTATWQADGDGRVVEASLSFEAGGSSVQQVRLLPSSEVPERPSVPVGAAPFEDEPLANYLPRSVMLDPACGETTSAQRDAARPCLDAAMDGLTVGDWVKAHDKQASLEMPPECA